MGMGGMYGYWLIPLLIVVVAIAFWGFGRMRSRGRS